MATFRENKTTFNSIFISYVKLIDDMVVCQNIVKLFFTLQLEKEYKLYLLSM